MKYVFSCGGTGGHINPGLAIAKEIQKRDKEAQIVFIGCEDGMENTLVKREGFPLENIDLGGFMRDKSWEATKYNIYNVKRAYKALMHCKKFVKEFKPDIVVGTGGYVSGPGVMGGVMNKIPAVIHEQNAFAGFTTKLVAKKVNKVFLSFPNTKGVEELDNTMLSGNPVRASIVNADREMSRVQLGVDKRPLVLSYGGSLGAEKINNAMVKVLELSQKDGLLNHIHATGEMEYKTCMEALGNAGVKTAGENGIFVKEYIYNMDQCMAACDIVIARAGAITLAEIACLGKPCILIPSPNVAENHQFFNAAVFRDAGAAVLIEEKDLTGELLYKVLLDTVCNSETLAKMSKAAKSLALPNATETIVDEIFKIIK